MSNSKLSSNNISGSDSRIDAKLEQHQMCGSKHCPGCGHKLEGRPDWVGLPAGVKFDPTDQELIEHLEAKVVKAAKDMKSHPLIDEFIPTIEGEDGICYTHPEKLPGVSRDGLSRHFFHRPSKAYTTGTRKRRKIQTECDLQGGETRWHKTGKTRPVMAGGKQKGCKKILVLYTNFGKNRKPEKTNWVMHQYHLGQNEEEKEGELVVSKIFYQTQPRQCNWSERSLPMTAEGSCGGDMAANAGSGSCSSSKEVMAQRDELMSPAGGVGASISSYGSLDIHHLKSDHFSFSPFRRSFDEVGMEEASTARKAAAAAAAASAGTCSSSSSEFEMRDHHHQRALEQHQQHVHQLAHDHHHHLHHHSMHHQLATTGFHISQPTHHISTIISPPPPLLHHSSIVLDQDSYHSSRIMIQNEGFQQGEEEAQHHKMGRSASGLEELIMGCTSTTIKQAQESSMANPRETDWMKYSSFWPDPDNPHLHGHG